MINLLFWIEDSIFDAPIDDEYIIEALYGKLTWHLMSKFVFPLIIFFRFEAFIAFWGIYFSDSDESEISRPQNYTPIAWI